MSKLNKLKLSGTTYELQDLSAQPLLSAGTGIQISGNVISCTGGSGTIDPSLDSGSTNAVANSAITEAVTVDTVYTKNADESTIPSIGKKDGITKVYLSKNELSNSDWVYCGAGNKGSAPSKTATYWLSDAPIENEFLKIYLITDHSEGYFVTVVIEAKAGYTLWSVSSNFTPANVKTFKTIVDGGTPNVVIPLLVDDLSNTDVKLSKKIDSAVSGKADTSAVTQDIAAAVSALTQESAFTEYTAATEARLGEDEEVTARALNELNDAVSGKQNTLIAGSGITISGNVISTEGGGGNPTVELTQAEYDALVSGGTVNPDVFYIITDATPINIDNYWTSAQTQSAITDSVSGKADTSAVTAVNNVLTAHTADTTIHVTSSDKSTWSGKQDALVSGTNIKTINNESILGSGNITIQGGGMSSGEVQTMIDTSVSGKQDTLVSGTNIKTINNESLLGSGNITIQGGGTITIDPTLDSGSTNAVANSAITTAFYDVDARLGEDEEVTAAALNALEGELANKQDVLVAGSGITIDSANTISCTVEGGGMTEDDELLLATALTDLNDRKMDASEVKANYQKKGDYVTTSTLNTRLANYETALDEQNVEEVTAYALNDLNDRVSDNTTALGGLKLVKITQSQYTALTTKDENTLYIVVADPS